jgi:predicted nucleotidyltransferase
MVLHGIEIPKAQIEVFCRANGIKRLAFFGSVLRDDFTSDSDIDVLVEFHAGVRVGYLAVARMARELTALLGREVDLRTPAELHRAFRDEVLKEALVEYVAA